MKDWKIVLLLFSVGLGFRIVTYLVFSNEIVAGNDQMQEIMLGRMFASGDHLGLLHTYWAPAYPFLIGIVSYLIDSPVIPAIVVSIAAGSCIVPLTFYLVRQSYGRSAAVIASIISIFFPHFINGTFALRSENIYIVWILASLIAGWRAIYENSYLFYAFAGVLLGAAYLTRSEAIGYPIFFVIAALIYGFREKRPLIRNTIPRAAVFVVCFLLLAAPYIIYLHGELGTWTVSGKVQANTLVGHLEEELGEVSSEKPPEGFQLQGFAKYYLYNLYEAHEGFPQLLPPFLLILAAVGLFTDIWNGERLAREIYLVSFCLITIAGYAAAIIQVRYFFILLPIFLGWIAVGFGRLIPWLNETKQLLFRKTAPRTINYGLYASILIGFVFVYTLPVFFFMRSNEESWRTRAYEERDAGLWIRRNDSSNPIIFTRSMRPAFYAEGSQVLPRSENLNEVIADIREQKVKYVVTSKRSLAKFPELEGLDEILRNDPQFEVVYNSKDNPNYEISIFRAN